MSKDILQKWIDASKSIELTSPDQIPTLPWVGNHAFDCALFEKCQELLMTLTDREEQRRCVHLTTLHGMGIDESVSDEDLDFCLEQGKEVEGGVN